MARQLQLLEQAPEWHLDDDTRAVGRRGVAAAREALAAAREAMATGRTGTDGKQAA
jgi:hypothetical protein